MVDKNTTVTVQAPQRGAIITTTSGFGDSLGPFEKREVRVGAVQMYVLAGCYVIGAPPGAPVEPLEIDDDDTLEETPVPVAKPIRNK